MDKYKIRVPSGAPVYPTTDENWFQFPYVMLSIAKKNSGKTCSLSQFLHIQHKMDRLDRLILISPTAHTNAHYFVNLPLAEEDIIEPSIHSAKQLMDIVENEAYLFDKYHDDMVEWRRLQKEIKSHKDIHDIDEDLLLYFDRMERPKYKYMRGGKPYKPIISAFFDDCQGTMCYSPSVQNKLPKLVIAHRHQGAIVHGDKKAIGVNLIFAVQNYTSNSLGIPKSIRGNCNIIAIFKSKNIQELKLIAEEVAGEVDQITFFKVFEQATSVPYGFLTIDLNPKKTVKSMFRRNWDEYLYV
jgi:hypothetical protein